MTGKSVSWERWFQEFRSHAVSFKVFESWQVIVAAYVVMSAKPVALCSLHLRWNSVSRNYGCMSRFGTCSL